MIEKGYTIKDFPIDKKITADGASLNRYVNLMHVFFQVDIAHIRKQIRISKKEGKRSISITACLLYCFTQTLDKNKETFALVGKRNKYYQFDEANVFFPFAFQQEGKTLTWYKIVKRANKKSLLELEDDLQKIRKSKKTFTYAERLFMNFPAIVRRLFYRRMMRTPLIRKEEFGNVYFSSTMHLGNSKNMMYGLPAHFHSVGMFVGTFKDEKNRDLEKPNSSILAITLSLDHLISDGSTLTKLYKEFIDQVENFSL